MTFSELEQHRKLQEELDAALERLKNLYDKAYPRAQIPDGMPHSGGGHDKIPELAEEIDDYRQSIEPLKQEVKASKDRVSAYIKTIPDRDMRLILSFRFVRNFQWKIVAHYVGQFETAKTVSQKVYDFFGSADKGCDD